MDPRERNLEEHAEQIINDPGHPINDFVTHGETEDHEEPMEEDDLGEFYDPDEDSDYRDY